MDLWHTSSILHQTISQSEICSSGVDVAMKLFFTAISTPPSFKFLSFLKMVYPLGIFASLLLNFLSMSLCQRWYQDVNYLSSCQVNVAYFQLTENLHLWSLVADVYLSVLLTELWLVLTSELVLTYLMTLGWWWMYLTEYCTGWCMVLNTIEKQNVE